MEISTPDAIAGAVRNLLAGPVPAGAESISLYDTVVGAAEKPLITEILKRNGWNQSRAAEMLGINRNTLHVLILRHAIVRPA